MQDNKLTKADINSILSQNIEDSINDLEKGKELPIGTVRKHGGTDMIKTAQGWKPKGGDKTKKVHKDVSAEEIKSQAMKEQREDSSSKPKSINDQISEAPIGSVASGGGYSSWTKTGKNSWYNKTTNTNAHNDALFSRIGSFSDFKIKPSKKKSTETNLPKDINVGDKVFLGKMSGILKEANTLTGYKLATKEGDWSLSEKQLGKLIKKKDNTLNKAEISKEIFELEQEEAHSVIFDLEKAVPVGTIKDRGYGRYKKTAEGWKYVGRGSGKKTAPGDKGKGVDKKKVEPKGWKEKDAKEYAQKLKSEGKGVKEIREKLEENYPGTKDRHSKIMTEILEQDSDSRARSELKELKEVATLGRLDDAGYDRIKELESRFDNSEPTNKPEKAEAVKNKKESLSSVKQVIDNKSQILRKLEDNGISPKHQDYKKIEEAFSKFEPVAKELSNTIGKEIPLRFDVELSSPGKYNEFSIGVYVNKYDLKKKYPEEYKNASAGLASSKENNFAAAQFGKMLNEKLQGTNFSSAGYSHAGSLVGHTLVSTGSGYSNNKLNLKKAAKK